MPTGSLCGECGAEIRAESPQGLCARCLLGFGLAAGGEPGADTVHGTPGQSAGVTGPAARGAAAGDGRLRDYELLGEIARGGMGVVYRARQVSLDRIVAVKMILAGRFAGRAQALRFQAEAEAAAKLQHPNIVRVYETGEHEGQPFFSMDYVAGGDLAGLVREKPLSPRRAAGLVRTLAEAIHYAHEQGVLHRDLKPSNVLLDAAGRPRITDFGLARRVEQDSLLTVTGQVLGSPSFMPPEQAGAKRGKAGRHSDVYALGGILFFLLTGRPPFVAESVAETLQHVLHSEPLSPRLLNPGVPPDLATICLKSLEKEPGRRYATAQEQADELGRFLADEPVLARPAGRAERAWRWCRRKPALAGVIGIAGLLLAALGIGTPVALWRISSARLLAEAAARQNRQGLYAADMLDAQRAIEDGDLARARERLANHIPGRGGPDLRAFEWRYLWNLLPGEEVASWSLGGETPRHVTVSADGRWVAAGSRVWETSGSNLVHRLRDPGAALLFAPGGATLLVTDDAGLRRVDVRTGEAAAMPTGGRVWAAAFSRSGRWLATGGEGGLQLWDAQTWRQVATAPGLTFTFFTARGLAFTPDERRLLANTGYPLRQTGELRVLEVPSLRPEAAAVPANNLSCFAYSPETDELWSGGWDGVLRSWPDGRLQPPGRVTGQLLTWIADVHFLPGSRLVATAGADRCVRLWEPGGASPVRTLLGHADEIWAMTPAPDGSAVFTVSPDGTVRKWAVSPLHPPGTLLADPHPVFPVGVSADGQRVATLSAGQLRFWDRKGRGVGEFPERGPRWPELQGVPADPLRGRGMVAVAPDFSEVAVAVPGQPVVLQSLADGRRRIFAGSQSAEPLVAFSPDGKLLATLRGPRHVVLWDVAAAREAAVIGIPNENDGRTPFAFAGRTNLLAVAGKGEVLLWDLGAHREIRRFRTRVFLSLALSADGLALAVGDSGGRVQLYDTRSGERTGAPLGGHLSSVDVLAFSGDGRTLVTGGDQRIKLWDLASRREVASVRHRGLVIFAAFAANDELLVSADAGLSVRVWSAPRSLEPPAAR